MKAKIYLDYNASAPIRPSSLDAMTAVLGLEAVAYNASSVHGFGREGRRIIEEARGHVAALVGAPAAQVIFNSGATEGNNTVIRHFESLYPHEAIAVSAVEHPSVLQASQRLRIIPVDENGLVQPDALDRFLSENGKVSLVSVMMVNNETGIIQNVSDISQVVHRYGALLHCDAVQAAGRVPVNMAEQGIDFLTLSAHKIGGAQGVGALVLGGCGQNPVLLTGGGQEKSLRAGTENVAGIAAFGAAAKECLEYMNHYQALGKWRDELEAGLKRISPDVVIHGETTARVANTSFFSLSGLSAQTAMIALDLEGIAVSNGSACSSGVVKPSYVLKAMGMGDDLASSALRVSLGWATKGEDITAFLGAWEKIVARRKK